MERAPTSSKGLRTSLTGMQAQRASFMEHAVAAAFCAGLIISAQDGMIHMFICLALPCHACQVSVGEQGTAARGLSTACSAVACFMKRCWEAGGW